MDTTIDVAKAKIDDLVSLNIMKSNYLSKLKEVTKLQSIDISSNSLNSLLDHIREKQEIMNKIDEIDKKFYTNFQELKLCLEVKSLEDVDINEYPEISNLKLSVREVMNLLGEIDKQDKININEAKLEMNKLKEDMKEIQTHSKVIRNYGTSSVSSYGKDYQGFYIDGKK